MKHHAVPKEFEKHRALVLDYNKVARSFNTNSLLESIKLIVTLGFLYYISEANIPFSKLLACLFALLAVFFMAWDYEKSKKLDIKVVKLITEGINLEKANPSFDRIFHNTLRKFSVVKSWFRELYV